MENWSHSESPWSAPIGEDGKIFSSLRTSQLQSLGNCWAQPVLSIARRCHCLDLGARFGRPPWVVQGWKGIRGHAMTRGGCRWMAVDGWRFVNSGRIFREHNPGNQAYFDGCICWLSSCLIDISPWMAVSSVFWAEAVGRSAWGCVGKSAYMYCIWHIM